MQEDVAHLIVGLIRECAAKHTAQHLVNSKRTRFQSRAIKHAKLGQCMHKEDQSSMPACAVDYSLTLGALLLLNVLGTIGYAGAM